MVKSYLEQVMSPLLEKRQVPGDNNLTECTNDNYEIIVIRAQCGVYEIYKPKGPGCSAQAKQGCY